MCGEFRALKVLNDCWFKFYFICAIEDPNETGDLGLLNALPPIFFRYELAVGLVGKRVVKAFYDSLRDLLMDRGCVKRLVSSLISTTLFLLILDTTLLSLFSLDFI